MSRSLATLIGCAALVGCAASEPAAATDAALDAVDGATSDAVCEGKPMTCCRDRCDSCSDESLREARSEACVLGVWTCPAGMVRRTRTCSAEELCAARGGPRWCCETTIHVVGAAGPITAKLRMRAGAGGSVSLRSNSCLSAQLVRF